MTEEEFETKKQQFAAIESEETQAQSGSNGMDQVKRLAASLSPVLETVKTFAMQHKKLTGIVLAVALLVVGFLPGYSLGRKHPSEVNLTFGSPDESIEVKGKGSSKNPYHLNEDIVFETFNTDCGQYVTYTVNISRIFRASALTRYMDAGKNSFDDAGLIVSIRVDWESNNTDTVSITPKIGIVYRNSTENEAAWYNHLYGRDGKYTEKLYKGTTYSEGIIKQTQLKDEEFDHIQINYSTKDMRGEMVEYRIYVAFDPSAVES